MRRADKFFNLITKWEYDKRTELEIVNKFSEMILQNEFDYDLYYDINDALHWKGYSYQFEVPKENGMAWNSDEYYDLVSNVTKSKDKTKDLCVYLYEMDDYVLTLSSLHFIKLKYLIDLKILPNYQMFKPIINMNLYDVYMMCFTDLYDDILIEKDAIKLILEKLLNQMGMRYVNLDYMQFRMGMEYLLWTITKSDKSKEVYKKINTIKVAFYIAPKEYFMWNDKIYFNEDIHKNLVKYLSLIDKKEIKRIVNKYKDSIHLLESTGYKLLFNML